MRHSNSRRSRGRNNNSNNGRRNNNQRSHTFDSNGPDVRIRGNAFQVNEKYEALARDAAAAGDAVLAESYRQHAEHYQRVINELSGGNNNKDNNQSRKKGNGAADAGGKQEADGNSKDETKTKAADDGNNSGGKQRGRRPQRQPRNVKNTQPAAEPVEA